MTNVHALHRARAPAVARWQRAAVPTRTTWLRDDTASNAPHAIGEIVSRATRSAELQAAVGARAVDQRQRAAARRAGRLVAITDSDRRKLHAFARELFAPLAIEQRCELGK